MTFTDSRPQMTWAPPPAQAPAREGFIDIPGTRLFYWDTGGAGEPIVLLHPATGSAAVWLYQQPIFAAAGHRVIAYSRRGHTPSERGPDDTHGTASGELHMLVEHLKLDRFHIVGSAAGGFIVPDYALSHSERLLSMTIASSQGGGDDPDYRATISRIASKQFIEMPASFRELGPSYRAGYPDGVRQWEELEHTALFGGRIRQPNAHKLTWGNLAKITVPAQMFTGDADLYIPPWLMQEYARHIPGCETAIIPGAGHSAYWEQPNLFNKLVLDFVGRHPAR
jgi:pimeloyl-ACP methyl ester carboxylesterase